MSSARTIRAKASEETQLKNQIFIHEIQKMLSQNTEDSHPKFYIDTYGCQMNEHDSETLTGMLLQMGYIPGTSYDDASLVIINTCCVRENAEMKVFGNLGHLKPRKEMRKDLKIAVCGCMMQQTHIVEKIRKKNPHVDLVFGTHNLHQFPQLLLQTFGSKSPIVEVWESEGDIVEGLPVIRKSGPKAFVNIMFGCDNFCSYCIVPYTRGRERSRIPEDIIDEIRQLSSEGVKEITLLGQNVNSYGAGLVPPISFSELLRKINEISGIERIRFMTSHPKDVSDDLIQVMVDCHKICEHIHLPVQAGSNRLLDRMNRYYTREQYLDLVERLYTVVPDIRITTDIIIGFPGEDETDIDELIDLIQKVRFQSAFTFIYSPRKGTPAAEMTNQIDDDVKHQRFNRMLAVLNESVVAQNAMLNGQILEVLAESVSTKDSSIVTGRSRGNEIVTFKGTSEDVGKTFSIHITKTRGFSVFGEKIE